MGFNLTKLSWCVCVVNRSAAEAYAVISRFIFTSDIRQRTKNCLLSAHLFKVNHQKDADIFPHIAVLLFPVCVSGPMSV